jgi:hypothetical protein
MPLDPQASIANELASIINISQNGWSPRLAIKDRTNEDLTVDRVLQVSDWFGGVSTKPQVGLYIGSTGFVSDIADAINIRGDKGTDGLDAFENRSYNIQEANNSLDFLTVSANSDPQRGNNTLAFRIELSSPQGVYQGYDIQLSNQTAVNNSYQNAWTKLEPVRTLIESEAYYNLEFKYNTTTNAFNFRIRGITPTFMIVNLVMHELVGVTTYTILDNNSSNEGLYADTSEVKPFTFKINTTLVPIPKTGTMYNFGDSQTAQVNTSGKWYTSGGIILPQFQWVRLFATSNGKNLSVLNYGQGSTKMSWLPDQPFIKSVFNKTGNLPYFWTGVATVMGGWNNLDAGTDATNNGFFTVLERSHIAMIYRLLLDGYGGISVVGWGAGGSGDGTIDSWTTTGTSDSTALPVGESTVNIMPFYYSDNTGARYRTKLAIGQYCQFTLSGKSSVALFYETTQDGGAFDVFVNGVNAYSGTSLYINAGGNDLGSYPQAIILKNVPSTAEIKIESTSGNVYFLAYGHISASNSITQYRTVLYSTTTGNTNGHSDVVLQRSNKAIQNAVQCMSDNYNVFFVNSYNNWEQDVDSEKDDVSHLTISGCQHIATAYDQAIKLSYSPNDVIVDLKISGTVGVVPRFKTKNSIGDSLLSVDESSMRLAAEGPRIHLDDTAGILNEKYWDINATGGKLRWTALNDAKDAETEFFVVERIGFENFVATITAALTAKQFVLSDLNVAPASISDTGTKGEVRITADYIFVCVATNTWKRVPISTW